VRAFEVFAEQMGALVNTSKCFRLETGQIYLLPSEVQGVYPGSNTRSRKKGSEVNFQTRALYMSCI
jgi:hypothetical protein